MIRQAILTALLCAAPALVLAEEDGRQPLLVAMSGDYAPLHSPADGRFVGLEADLAALIADRLGRSVEFVDAKAQKLTTLAAVAQGKADLAINSITDTPERRATVDFTKPYLVLRYRLAGVGDTGSLATLTAAVGVTSDLAAAALTKAAPKAKQIRYPSYNAALDDFAKAKIDWIAGEDVGLIGAIAKTRLLLHPEPFGESPLAAAVPKGKAGEYDAVLAKLGPELVALGQKWRPGELESLGVTGFSGVSVGFSRACALNPDKTAVCWGEELFNGKRYAPRGVWSAIIAGTMCGLRPKGKVECWGPYEGFFSDDEKTFTSLKGHSGYMCAQDADDRELDCWNLWNDTPAAVPVGAAKEYCVGNGFGCLLDDAGSASCFGERQSTLSAVPKGPLRGLSCGDNHACALSAADGTPRCWGSNVMGQTGAPRTSFDRVVAGGLQSCGLDAAGALTCWGNGMLVEPLEKVNLTSLVFGGAGVCGIDRTGRLLCNGHQIDRTPGIGSRALIGQALLKKLPTSWRRAHKDSSGVFREKYCDGDEPSVHVSNSTLTAGYGQDSDSSPLVSVAKDGDVLIMRSEGFVMRLRWPVDEGGTQVGMWTVPAGTGESPFVPESAKGVPVRAATCD